MNCKDLTICDYIKHNGTIKVVDAVYLYSVSVHDPSEDWSISEAKTYPVDDIEPIELTEDILVKNGFEKFAESQTLFDYTDNDIHLEYWIGDGCFRYYTAEIHYVHTLQHLLRLCGIEKELVID